MKKQTIAIIAMIITGFIIGGIAYATGTTITNTSITTPSLIVNGITVGEGDFHSYSNILNTTDAIGASRPVTNLFVSLNGTITFGDNSHTEIIDSSGTHIFDVANNGNSFQYQFATSPSGKYKAIINGANGNSFDVFRGNTDIQTLGITPGQFQFNGLSTASMAFSEDGKFIAIVGVNAAANHHIVLLFQGS